MNEYVVVKYTHQGEFVGVVAGMGKNKGTWDATHSKTQAYVHKRACQMADWSHRYVVESAN